MLSLNHFPCRNSKADFCFINQIQQIQLALLTFCLHLLGRIYCLFRAPRTEKDDEEAEIDTSDAKDGRLACSSNWVHWSSLFFSTEPTQNKRSRCFRTSKFPSSAGSCCDTYWLGICAPWGAKCVRHALDHNVVGNHAVLQWHSEDSAWMAWRLAAWRLIPKLS